jgi:hypothetical protein
VIAQIAEFAFENFGAPDWVLKSVVVILLLGLPLALFFAWAFEMTPEGLKREKDVDRSESITPQTGRRHKRRPAMNRREIRWARRPKNLSLSCPLSP